jgi:hypothetical protein
MSLRTTVSSSPREEGNARLHQLLDEVDLLEMVDGRRLDDVDDGNDLEPAALAKAGKWRRARLRFR